MKNPKIQELILHTSHMSIRDQYVSESVENWPVVYILQGKKYMYIGETTNLYNRIKSHLTNKEKAHVVDKWYVIYDIEANKSATLDIESKLIRHLWSEGSYVLLNKNHGIKDHDYFDRQLYEAKFVEIWNDLHKQRIVQKSLTEVQNSDLFKYSPYTTLNTEQYTVAHTIVDDILQSMQGTFLVHWLPGTWKSVVASYLMKYMIEHKDLAWCNIGLVVPMVSLRKTFKNVFRHISWLKSSMVLWPNDVVKWFDGWHTYDILLVDEAHRLQKRKNLTNYKRFDDINKILWLWAEGTQLDWIMQLSKTQILFYDQHQSIKPTDVNADDFQSLPWKKTYTLTNQMRVAWWKEYIQFINDLFNKNTKTSYHIPQYDVKLFTTFADFRAALLHKDKEMWLSRMVAWYARQRRSKKDPHRHDIEIEGCKLFWNSTNIDRVNSPDSPFEVWCIHTVQGYDLNYVGVIIWDEITYNKRSNQFVVRKDKYYDTKWKAWIVDPDQLIRYVINIYKTLLTRWMKWTYIYVVDDDMRAYLTQALSKLTVVEDTL